MYLRLGKVAGIIEAGPQIPMCLRNPDSITEFNADIQLSRIEFDRFLKVTHVVLYQGKTAQLS